MMKYFFFSVFFSFGVPLFLSLLIDTQTICGPSYLWTSCVSVAWELEMQTFKDHPDSPETESTILQDPEIIKKILNV